jgi:hypothetical protein
MGMSKTPKYRLEISDDAGIHTQVWEGIATMNTLTKYLEAYINSLKLGGCNQHITRDLGFIPVPRYAKIIEQKTQKIKVEWKAPMFFAF